MRSYLFSILLMALMAVGLPVALPGTAQAAAALDVTVNTAVGTSVEAISSTIDTTCLSMRVCADNDNVSVVYIDYASSAPSGLSLTGFQLYGKSASGETCHDFPPIPDSLNGGRNRWNGRYVWGASAANNDDIVLMCFSD